MRLQSGQSFIIIITNPLFYWSAVFRCHFPRIWLVRVLVSVWSTDLSVRSGFTFIWKFLVSPAALKALVTFCFLPPKKDKMELKLLFFLAVPSGCLPLNGDIFESSSTAPVELSFLLFLYLELTAVEKSLISIRVKTHEFFPRF